MPQPEQTKEWMTVEELADYLGLSVHTLNKWRSRGLGPLFTGLGPKGSAVRYWIEDVRAWLLERRKSSTNEHLDIDSGANNNDALSKNQRDKADRKNNAKNEDPDGAGA